MNDSSTAPAKMSGKKIGSQWLRIIVLVVLIVTLVIVNKNFLSAYNLTTMLEKVALILTMSLGTTLILIIGSIDLSLGSMISCSAVIIAVLIPRLGWLTYLVVVAFGLTAGFLNGFLFTKIRIPSFIATLGTMSIFTSLALVISKSSPVTIGKENSAYISWIKVKAFGFIPIEFLIALGLLLIAWIIQTKTRFGKSCHAIGANEKAARMSGIAIDRNKTIAFVLAGLAFIFGSIILTAKLQSGIPTVGTPYTLMSIAAVALGGTSLSGGKGGVLQTLLGTLLTVVITNGMVVIGVDSYMQTIAYGVVIIIALATTIDRSNKNLVSK